MERFDRWPARDALRGPAVLLLAALAVLAASGCSDDPADPQDDPPANADPLQGGMLSRDVVSGGEVSDELLLWVSDEAPAAIAAVRLAGQADVDPQPAANGGEDYRLLPDPGVALFTPGAAFTIEFLDAAGSPVATSVGQGPAADLRVLSPVADAEVSAQGFDLTWSSDGDGAVIIAVASLAGDATWQTTTGNDGSYTLDADDLAEFPRGGCRIRISEWKDTPLASIELGTANLILVLTGQVEVVLGV